MFQVGDKVFLKQPEEIPDWDTISTATQFKYMQCLDKELTISEKFLLNKYRFYETDLAIHERALIPAVNLPECTIEEFEDMFV